MPGAFTGASQKGKPGLFELAHGGTIFLDEIAEMDLPTQGRLLRVVQERKVMRLGSDQMIPVNVRVVAATNKDLGRLVVEGSFRDDLFYRLNVLRLRLPPLCRRREDIPGLAAHFLDQACGRPGRYALAEDALATLCEHPWPGNVRELQNVMARVAATHRDRVVSGGLVRSLLDVTPSVPAGSTSQSFGQSGGRLDARLAPSCPPQLPALGDGERERIREALARTNGRIGEAAKSLGISRSTLWRRMRSPVSDER